MYEKVMSFLIWLFSIDEQRSYEEQPQWLLVLFLSTPFSPKVWPLWVAPILVVAAWYGLSSA